MMEEILVIGAGMAGLTCAALLKQAGHPPLVLEKSRGIGGRIATRRTEAGRFDHGAQFARAHGDAFAQYLDAATARGAAAPWEPDGRPATVGHPAMRDLVAPLAEGLDIRFERQVTRLERGGSGWRAWCGDSSVEARRVVLTAPAPQARALVEGPAPDLARDLAAVRMAPCWALMIAGQPLPALPDQLRLPDGPIAWACRQSARPGRARDGEAWVIHASPGWSRTHLERGPEEVVPILLGALGELAGTPVDPPFARAHRWRYALTETPLGAPFLATADLSLHLGGDWCLGGRVEAAHQSGAAIAHSLSHSL